MHQEVDRAAVTRVLDLADILELIDDGLDERAFAQEQLVGEIHEHIAHILAQLGDEPEALRKEELLGEWRGDVALVAKKASEEPTDQVGNWPPIVGVAGREAQREQVATVVDHQMEFAAIEPSHRGLAAPCVHAEDPVLRDPRGMADAERGGVDEADPRTLPQLRVQVNSARYQVTRHEGHKAGITQEGGKLLAQMRLDMLGVEAFEPAIPRLLEENEDREDLGGMESGAASTMSSPRRQQLALPERFKALPKGVHGAIQIEYTPVQYLQFGLMGCRKPHHNPAGGISLIHNWILLAN